MPRILYIEDNRDNRMLVRRVLMASDYDFFVLEADNAIKGIEIARSDPPDLILMDLSMPEMDGLTATQRLRDLPQLNHVPIVALTANAMQGDKERTLQAGCDGYISKPIDVDKIADEVYRFLSCRENVIPVAQPTETQESAAVHPAPVAAANGTANGVEVMPIGAAPLPSAAISPPMMTGNGASSDTAASQPTTPQQPTVSASPGSSQPNSRNSVSEPKPNAE